MKTLPPLLSLAVSLVLASAASAQLTGPSSSQSAYLLPSVSTLTTKSILSVGDSVAKTGSLGQTYKMDGVPDGMGAYDNGDGTFTLLLNHELGNTLGVTRDHGSKGAFVSEWIIRKSDFSVVSGHDLIQNVYNWNATTQASNASASTFAFNRFCSADLAAASAFYNAGSGLGTTARIFLNGEEGGSTGYALANIATGASKGNSYVLGKFNQLTNGSAGSAVGGWENLLANPYAQDKTVVIGNNDGGTSIEANSLTVYVGTKTNTGSDADKAGLTNGVAKYVKVTGISAEISNSSTRATGITSGTAFTLSSSASTAFSRPEDGAWNPFNLSQYYFVTTDQIDTLADGVGSQKGRSRLWRLTFSDITNPDAGGTIDMLLDGTEGQNMLDNMTVDSITGHLLLQEDVGNSAHLGKIYDYNPFNDTLSLFATHDQARFGNIGIAATSPFNVDEESSGVIDISAIMGSTSASDRYYISTVQAHYGISGEFVEGGQLVLLHAVPEPSSWMAAAMLLGVAGTMRRKSRVTA